MAHSHGRVLRFHPNDEALASLSGYSAQQARFKPDAYRSTQQHVKLSARLSVSLYTPQLTAPVAGLLCSYTSRSELGCFTAQVPGLEPGPLAVVPQSSW